MLNFDHGVIEGAMADQFMPYIKKPLETQDEPFL